MDFDGHLVLCRHCAKRLMLALLGTRMPSCDHAIVPRDVRRIWCCPASTRSSIEAAEWLAASSPADGDLKVRFDTISLIVLNEQRAFMRHHTNVFSQA